MSDNTNSVKQYGSVEKGPRTGLTLATGRFRLPYHYVFLAYSTPRAKQWSRKAAVGSFWRSWESGIVEVPFLTAYEVDWIVAMRRRTHRSLRKATGLDLERVRLDKAYENREVIVFRVTHGD